jgi:hypothetical protein
MKKTGYWGIMIHRKLYLAHRLIFIWHNGFAPNEIDHINRVRADNRIENLRASTTSQNHANETHRENTLNKYRGLQRTVLAGKIYWGARIMVDGKRNHLGMFKTPEDAAKAYNDAAIKYYGEFANLNVL